MQVLSCVSKAWHPATLYPDEAQHAEWYVSRLRRYMEYWDEY
jgi:hypothetical protein